MNLGAKFLAAIVTFLVLYLAATIVFWVVGALGLIVKLAFVGLLIYGICKAGGMLKEEFSSDESR